MNIRKMIKIIISLLVVIIISARIYWVNHGIMEVKEQIYPMGYSVPYEKDFTVHSNEIIEGYYITVKNSEIITAKEFANRYYQGNIERVDPFVQYYYMVDIEVRNEDNQDIGEKGVNLSEMPLVGINYMMVVSYDAFWDVNPDLPGLGFSVKPGTSVDTTLAYQVIPQTHATYEQLVKDPPKLQITEFPVRKLLEIQ